jgi:hypothetical protein
VGLGENNEGRMGKDSRVSDPDGIRIQSGQWIRIHIRNPDPDPGGQKLPTKKERKNYEISCFVMLDVLF